MMGLLVALGWADDSGRALRRRGDWFVGESNGAVARHVRSSVGALAGALERFDPPADLAPIVIPPDPAKVPYGPFLPGAEPPPPVPTEVAWWHPLAGPRRAMPLSEARRFGASRPPPRPRECELGHCGVDLGTTLGEPVFAAQDGVIERIERDADRGGRAGRYIRIGHKNGTVLTRYIHLDSIRADLSEGAIVHGGDLIGRVGKTGVMYSGPHLHFGISLRKGGPGGEETYIDPEPLLRTWQLPDASQLLASRDTIRK
jgi:murein DD-endopeptidase MepM/ murein hydrolase activator NlpD